MDDHPFAGGAFNATSPRIPLLPAHFDREQNRVPIDDNTQFYSLSRRSVTCPPLMISSTDSFYSEETLQPAENSQTPSQEAAQLPSYGAVGFDRTSDVMYLYSISGDLPSGIDTLTFPGFCGNIVSISGLHAATIEARSPLIAAAFESSRSGQRLHLETLSEQTATPFVRFLYTGSYAESGDWEDVPTSLLLHCKMCYLGDIYDMPELKSQAYINILRQCEFGCSSPDKPIDLCSAISFTYENLSSHEQTADAIVHYCVSCFLSHNLGADAGFRELAYHLRAFHQDLVKACKDRDYADESAAAIIQMPYKHYTPETYASIERPAIACFEDLIHHFHGSDRFDEDASPKKRQRVTFGEKPDSPTKYPKKADSTTFQPETSLPLRPFPATTFTAKSEASMSSNPISLPIRQYGGDDEITHHRPIWKRRHMKDFHDATIDGGFAQFAEDLKASFRPSRVQKEQESLLVKQEEGTDDFYTELQMALEASKATAPIAQDASAQSSSCDKPTVEPSENSSAWDWEDWGPDPVQATTAIDADNSVSVPENPTAAAESAGVEMPSMANDALANESDSDSDASSWVDVPLEPSTSTRAANASASRTKHARSASSDSDWELC
ncbi:hypothetical protein Q7P37_003555 [Cladosporium fusiforme]